MRKLVESAFIMYAYLSEATQTLGVDSMFALKAHAVDVIASGVTGSIPSLRKYPMIKTPYFPVGLHDLTPYVPEQPEKNLKTSVTEGVQIELPNGPVRLSGSDVSVTGITVLSRKQHNYLNAPVSDSAEIQEQAIQVTFEQGRNQIELTVGVDNGKGYTSYRDSQFYASESSYFPDRSVSHPPYHNRLHKWRDVVVGAKEELAISLLVDYALRTTLGEDKGFPNRDKLLAHYNLIDNNLDIYQKKLLVKPPPPQYHGGIESLFNDIIPVP